MDYIGGLFLQNEVIVHIGVFHNRLVRDCYKHKCGDSVEWIDGSNQWLWNSFFVYDKFVLDCTRHVSFEGGERSPNYF